MIVQSTLLRTTKAAALLAAMILVPVAAIRAQTPEKRGPNESPLMRSQFERWKDRATQIEAFVREGKYKKAEDTANGMIRELTKKVTGGPDAGRILAMPISLRALARVGLKKESDGLWDYQMAAVLWPAIRNVKLAAYGPTGARLEEILAATPPLSDLHSAPISKAALDGIHGEESAKITPPRAVKQPEIEFPASLSTAMKSGQAVILMSIDEEGRPHSPTIEAGSAQNALFLFSAMEGVRGWRFEPATFNGKATPVLYTLMVNYKHGS